MSGGSRSPSLNEKLDVMTTGSYPSSPGSSRPNSPILPTSAGPKNMSASKGGLHPAVYVVTWISLSSMVILFNKWVLDTMHFPYPIFLTTWHMLFATVATQVLSKTTTLLDGRKSVPMTRRTYTRAILPIGLFFSLSLICGNKAYLHLSVAFIQMLKATTPVAVLLASWATGLEKTNYRVLGNVSVIVAGVIVASYGEVAFNTVGVIYQVSGLCFEATRLVLIQKLLSSAEFKMDPLVSLYYYAPVCTVMNFIIFLATEAGTLQWADIQTVGIVLLVANASVALLLNVSVVFLIGRTSSLVLTLCGVLKDILLVVASIVIWGTTVTLIQVLGYAVALSGLTYYKLGPEALRERFNVIGGSFSRNACTAVYKSIYAGLAFILLISVFGSVYTSNGSSSASAAAVTSTPASAPTIATVTATPEPITIVQPILDPMHDVDNLTYTRPFLDHAYAPRRPLDIIVAMYREDSSKLATELSKIKSAPVFKALGAAPHITIYVKDPISDLAALKTRTSADVVVHLPNLGREAATYLHHITSNWDNLAKHTLFIQAEIHDMPAVLNRINEFFVPETGMLSLGFGHNTCSCENCSDASGRGTVWNRIPQIYSAVYGELCPTDEDILLGFQGQFIVSAARIRGNTRRMYKHLLDLLVSDAKHWIHKDVRDEKIFSDDASDPYFGHQVERSWMLIFQCADPKLANTCSRLWMKRGGEAGKEVDSCQCVDAPPKKVKGVKGRRV